MHCKFNFLKSNKHLNQKIRLGIINFTNCLPINYCFDKWAIERITLNRGNPVLLNQMIKDGQIDAAPISSFEYLNNQKSYTLIKEAVISSDGECGSVILFSNFPLEELEGKKIALPNNSATSINMLKVLLIKSGLDLNKITFLNHRYHCSLQEFLNSEFDAVLCIGDNALFNRINCSSKILKYDLGCLWKNFTGLPAVFGTWVARTDWATKQADDFIWIKFLIDKAVEAGSTIYLNDVIKLAASDLNLEKIVIEDYLTSKISYKFGNLHEKSLALFEKYIKELLN